VEAAYDTNDMMLIFFKKSSVELPLSSFGGFAFQLTPFFKPGCQK
jgi:hypothetical protein